ncbi:MAG TPA: hypothetical protein VNM15_04215 [Candidatus Binatia bacterium]|nr:hypothetical protein [Candidatus Binatia bacterium]
MALKENLRPTVDAKTEALGQPRGLNLHYGPDTSRIALIQTEKIKDAIEPHSRQRLALGGKFHGTPVAAPLGNFPYLEHN